MLEKSVHERKIVTLPGVITVQQQKTQVVLTATVTRKDRELHQAVTVTTTEQNILDQQNSVRFVEDLRAVAVVLRSRLVWNLRVTRRRV